MSFAITASGNFDNKKSYSGLKHHLQHDGKIDHKNKFLLTDESKRLRKYNQHVVLENYDDWTEKTFSDYVKKHDEKEKNKERKFGSVKRFLQVDSRGKLRKTFPDQMYVAKLGDFDSWKKYKEKAVTALSAHKHISKDKAEAIFLKAVANGLADWAKTFNERNPNIKMFDSYVHMDEEGAPHSHSHIMPIVIKENGKKPSTSLNTALATQFDMPRKGKTLLAKFRKQEDQALIDCVEKSVQENCFGLRSNLKLTRKQAEVTGVAHDEYVKNQHFLDQQQEKLNNLQKEISSNETTLANIKKQAEKIAEREQAVTTRENNVKQRENNVAKRENDVKQREKRVAKLGFYFRENYISSGIIDLQQDNHDVYNQLDQQTWQEYQASFANDDSGWAKEFENFVFNHQKHPRLARAKAFVHAIRSTFHDDKYGIAGLADGLNEKEQPQTQENIDQPTQQKQKQNDENLGF